MRPFSKLMRKSARFVPRVIPLMGTMPMASMNAVCFKHTFSFSECKTQQTQSQNLLKSSYSGDGFYIEQLHVGCLAIYSYYIESNG